MGYKRLQKLLLIHVIRHLWKSDEDWVQKAFFNYFKAFGLTERTGIDLPAEATSYYQGLNGMGAVELASCSFGQTNKVTPIEMITAYAKSN